MFVPIGAPERGRQGLVEAQLVRQSLDVRDLHELELRHTDTELPRPGQRGVLVFRNAGITCVR